MNQQRCLDSHVTTRQFTKARCEWHFLCVSRPTNVQEEHLHTHSNACKGVPQFLGFFKCLSNFITAHDFTSFEAGKNSAKNQTSNSNISARLPSITFLKKSAFLHSPFCWEVKLHKTSSCIDEKTAVLLAKMITERSVVYVMSCLPIPDTTESISIVITPEGPAIFTTTVGKLLILKGVGENEHN